MVLVAGVVCGVAPAPGAQAVRRPTIEEVERRVTLLHHDAEVASEKYNETREELASLSVRAGAARVQLDRQRREVTAAKRQLGRLAAETYRRGPLSPMDVMLDEDADAVLAREGLLPSLASRQAGATKRLAEAERRLAAAHASLSTQQRRAAEARARLEAYQDVVTGQLAEAEAELGRLRAAERAAVLRATRGDGGGEGPGGALTCRATAVQAPDARVRAVLEFACAQIGDPYVWAAEGPDAWDCSGFTMKAWQQAGVRLPHSSRMQATYGTPVTPSQLRPGDLVFFHSPISHVGIYLGDGLMLHAPRSGDVVKVAPMSGAPSAAVRL